MSAEPEPQVVQETQELITQKLIETGQLAKMQAMVIEASLAALKEEAGDQLFLNSADLRAEKKSDAGLTNLSLVVDYLNTLGLLHAANVVQLEAGLEAADLKPRADLQSEFGVSGKGSVLSTIVNGGATSSSNPAASTTAAVEDEEPASGVSKAGVSASVAAILAKHGGTGDESPTKENSPKADTGAVVVAPQNPKSKETTYYISNWENRDFERKDQVKGQNIAIEDLKNCKIIIYDALDSMTMDACVDCELIVAACEGSIFIRECENVKITVACKQLRFRDCKYCPVYLFASTDPVVESSHHIDFYPFNLRIPGLTQAMKDCRLDPKVNRFTHVYDFTEDDPSLPKPHFTIKMPNHGVSMRSAGEKHGTPEAPPEIQMLLEGKLEVACSSESKNKSQDIKSGGQSWNAAAAPVEAHSSSEENTPVKAAPAPAPANTLARSSSSEGAYSDFEPSDDDDSF